MTYPRKGHKTKPKRRIWFKRMGKQEPPEEEQEVYLEPEELQLALEQGYQKRWLETESNYFPIVGSDNRESYIVQCALYRFTCRQRSLLASPSDLQGMKDAFYDATALYFLLKYLFGIKIDMI